jgi:hypothetical protein
VRVRLSLVTLATILFAASTPPAGLCSPGSTQAALRSYLAAQQKYEESLVKVAHDPNDYDAQRELDNDKRMMDSDLQYLQQELNIMENECP